MSYRLARLGVLAIVLSVGVATLANATVQYGTIQLNYMIVDGEFQVIGTPVSVPNGQSSYVNSAPSTVTPTTSPSVQSTAMPAPTYDDYYGYDAYSAGTYDSAAYGSNAYDSASYAPQTVNYSPSYAQSPVNSYPQTSFGASYGFPTAPASGGG